jgi:phosphoserine aminotransferase
MTCPSLLSVAVHSRHISGHWSRSGGIAAAGGSHKVALGGGVFGGEAARCASDAVLGRSHRSKPGKARLQAAIDLTRKVLQVPDSYLIGIVPGSDTGAVEMAMWSLLGPRKVQMLAFESFGKDWVTDVVKQLKLPAEVLEAPYGELPDLSRVDPAADLVFTWNGTTSGVRVPNADFISADRTGITICDATSACVKVLICSTSNLRSSANLRKYKGFTVVILEVGVLGMRMTCQPAAASSSPVPSKTSAAAAKAAADIDFLMSQVRSTYVGAIFAA